MNFPITIFGIHLHQIFEIIAYTVGYRYYLYLRKQHHDTISDQNRLWIFIAAAAGGFLGSHILAMFEQPIFLQQPSIMAFIQNKTIVGGLLGGLVAVESCKKILNIYTSSGDLMTYPIILAIAIGRLGCFAEGLEDGTYGIESSLPWAIDFGDGLYRHPTQLYEIAFLAALLLGIKFLEKKVALINGGRFKIFLTSYLLFRLFIEFIKPNKFYIFNLCAIQIACIFGLLYYWSVWTRPQHLVQKSVIP